MLRFFLFGVFAALISFPAAAQSRPFIYEDEDKPSFGLAGNFYFPMNFTNEIDWGITVKYKINENLCLYAALIVSSMYYYYQNGSWYGPDVWAAVPQPRSSPSDWIFKHTESITEIGLLYYWPGRFIKPFVGAGLGCTWLTAPDSLVLSTYPDVERIYKEYESNFISRLVLLLKAGADIPLFTEHLSLGVELVFFLETAANMENLSIGNYFLDHFYFSLNLTGWI